MSHCSLQCFVAGVGIEPNELIARLLTTPVIFTICSLNFAYLLVRVFLYHVALRFPTPLPDVFIGTLKVTIKTAKNKSPSSGLLCLAMSTSYTAVHHCQAGLSYRRRLMYIYGFDIFMLGFLLPAL